MSKPHTHVCPRCGDDWLCTGSHYYALDSRTPPRDNHRERLICTPCLQARGESWEGSA